METRITRLEAIIPSLVTREDPAHLEGRMNSAIQKVETTLHKELTNQTAAVFLLVPSGKCSKARYANFSASVSTFSLSVFSLNKVAKLKYAVGSPLSAARVYQ